MRFILYFSLILVCSVLLVSCSKENSVTVVDEIPTVEPSVVEVPGNVSILGIPFNVDTVQIVAIQNGTSNEIIGYNLIIEPELIVISGIDLSLQWAIGNPELNIQEGSYMGTFALTLSPESFDEIQEWFDRGADPNLIPSPILESYNASDITIQVRNLNLNTKEEFIEIPAPDNPSQLITVLRVLDNVDIALSGNLIDTNGNAFPLSGSFPATSSRIEF